MWLSLKLLMENSSARIVKQNNQNLCFGLEVKVSKSWLFIVLVLMPKSLLACRGSADDKKYIPPNNAHRNKIHEKLDAILSINLTGITDILDRNIKTAHNGWTPLEKPQKEWKDWYSAWNKENEKNAKGGDGLIPGRGPGSAFPDLPEWEDLGEGDPGDAVPPWGYIPLNIGRPSLCYLPLVKGEYCEPRMENGTEGIRYGYNPYTDDCQPYQWNGCGGTRNKFLTKVKCEKHCKTDPPESCSSDSGIRDKKKKNRGR